jgi:hypothetical protein
MDLCHLLRYINRAPQLPLILKPTVCELHAYVDASFAIHADMRSHYGYMIFFGSNENSPILVKSGKLEGIHRSSIEAKISDVNELASELLGYSPGDVNIMQGNLSCITLLQREGRNFQSHSRNIRVKWPFCVQEYLKQSFHLTYCPTDLMLANLLRKNLSGNLFR